MKFRTRLIILAGALTIASPVLAQDNANTVPAKPTGRSDVKSNGALKPTDMKPGTAAEGGSDPVVESKDPNGAAMTR